MRKVHLLRACFAFLAAIGAGQAHADITFQIGSNPPPGDENVSFTLGSSGSPILGSGGVSGLPVAFSSSIDALSVPPDGVPRIVAADGLLNSLSIGVPDGTFNSLIFNPLNGDGTAFVTALANEPGGSTQSFSFSYELGNGNNFLTIVAINGESLASVTIEAAEGFEDLRQVRIGGAELSETETDTDTDGGEETGSEGADSTAIPEPATAGLGLLALSGVALAASRRRA